MTTISDIVTRAYRLLNVVAHDDAMTSDQAAVGLEAFNTMLSGWELDGLALSYTDKALTDAFPLADKFRDGVAHMLAQRIAPEFVTAFNADDFFRKMQAAYVAIPAVSFEGMLTTRDNV